MTNDMSVHQYAVSVGVTIRTYDEGLVETTAARIYSPTFYLHTDVQGITNEDHAKRIVLQWFEKLNFAPEDVDVMIAETNVDAPDLQANALLDRVKRSKSGTFAYEPFDLPAGYVLVRAGDGFECGVAPDGSVSS